MDTKPAYLTDEGGSMEQRRSFRFPARGPHQDALLKVGRTRVAAVLLDESAGGFAVFTGRDPGVRVGDRAKLKVDGYWYEVRVTYVEAERQPAGIGGGGAPLGPAVAFRIGLERVQDLGPLDDQLERLGPLGPLLRALPLSPFLTLVALTSFLTSVVVAAAISLLVSWFISESPRGEATAGAGPVDSRRWPDGPPVTGRRENGDRTRSEGRSGPDRPAGESLLLAPELVRDLALSPRQQDKIRQIGLATSQALDQSGDDRRRRREILDAACSRLLAVLDEDQQRKWSAVMAGGGLASVAEDAVLP